MGNKGERMSMCLYFVIFDVTSNLIGWEFSGINIANIYL